VKLPNLQSSDDLDTQYIVTSQLTDVRSDVDTQSSDGVLAGVLKQLCHQKIIILHPHRKLLHVCTKASQQNHSLLTQHCGLRYSISQLKDTNP